MGIMHVELIDSLQCLWFQLFKGFENYSWLIFHVKNIKLLFKHWNHERESIVGFKPNKNYGKSLEKVRKEREERVGLLVMPWCMWRVDSNGDEAPPVLRREWKEDAKRRLGLAGEVECYWEEKCILVHLVFPMMCRKQQRMQEAYSVSFNTYSDWVCSVKMM